MGVTDLYQQEHEPGGELMRSAARLSTAAHGLLGIVRYHYPNHPAITEFKTALDRYHEADAAYFRARLKTTEETP